MKIKIILWCCLFACSGQLWAQPEKNSFVTVPGLQSLLDMARKENKLVFIDCYFTGCHPCEQMDKEVYPNTTVLPLMERDFISVKVDVFKEKLGDTLVMRYALHGFPTLLVLNADGKLVSHESGYKDAGQFINYLEQSKTLDRQKKYLGGFASTYTDNYPAFYKARYTEKKNIDIAAANQFIHQQPDWLEEKTGLIILNCPQLDSDIEDYLLSHFKEYVSRFGHEMVHGRVDPLLVKRMSKAVANQPNEQAFQQFLQATSVMFPENNWKNSLQVLANGYYLGIAKDTTAYLLFMSRHPVIYHYYFTAFYSGLVAKKQDTPERCKLLCAWGDAVVDQETSLDIIRTLAFIHRKAGDEEGYKKYLQRCIDKLNKYLMPGAADYEKLLLTVK